MASDGSERPKLRVATGSELVRKPQVVEAGLNREAEVAQAQTNEVRATLPSPRSGQNSLATLLLVRLASVPPALPNALRGAEGHRAAVKNSTVHLIARTLPILLAEGFTLTIPH